MGHEIRQSNQHQIFASKRRGLERSSQDISTELSANTFQRAELSLNHPLIEEYLKFLEQRIAAQELRDRPARKLARYACQLLKCLNQDPQGAYSLTRETLVLQWGKDKVLTEADWPPCIVKELVTKGVETARRLLDELSSSTRSKDAVYSLRWGFTTFFDFTNSFGLTDFNGEDLKAERLPSFDHPMLSPWIAAAKPNYVYVQIIKKFLVRLSELFEIPLDPKKEEASFLSVRQKADACQRGLNAPFFLSADGGALSADDAQAPQSPQIYESQRESIRMETLRDMCVTSLIRNQRLSFKQVIELPPPRRSALDLQERSITFRFSPATKLEFREPSQFRAIKSYYDAAKETVLARRWALLLSDTFLVASDGLELTADRDTELLAQAV